MEKDIFSLESTLAEICEKIDRLLTVKDHVIIAIDGRAASGKSTASEYLSKRYSAPVVHADDFFLPFDMRTNERLSEPGGNIHYERMYAEVVSRLSEGGDISHGVFDCSAGAVTKHRTINTDGVVIVEGAYSTHPVFGKYYDLSVFITASAEVRLKRVEKRSNAQKAKVFKERWMPLEEKYIKEFNIDSSADILISTDSSKIKETV